MKNSINECDRCVVIAEADYKLVHDTILRPNVTLICDEPHDAYITKAPEIVVEVISLSTTQNYDFDETLCKARIDFEKVFKRFRK